jgi:hypothetical protein
MATKATAKTADADEYVEMFPAWVYMIPGAILIAIGFGGVAYLALF